MRKIIIEGKGSNKNKKVLISGQEMKVNHSWYRGENANFRPPLSAMLSSTAAKEYILKGWLPDQTFIKKDTRITTFGSCFAVNIARYLEKNGYNLLSTGQQSTANSNVFAVSCNAGIVNTFTMRQLFEWVYENKKPKVPVWHDYGAKIYEFSERNRQQTAKLFNKSEVFVITLGLSEVWYEKETNEVFSRSVPQEIFDEDKHGFRVSTIEENRENLTAIYRIIRKHIPNAKIVFTLSPVPLVATFRPVSCISANNVSKATLRVALDDVVREFQAEGNLFYWPSYEIVTELFPKPFWDDNRHVVESILDYIMTLFEAYYCEDKCHPDMLIKRFFQAAISGGNIPEYLHETVTDKTYDEAIAQLQELTVGNNPALALALGERLYVDYPDSTEIQEILTALPNLISTHFEKRFNERKKDLQSR